MYQVFNINSGRPFSHKRFGSHLEAIKYMDDQGYSMDDFFIDEPINVVQADNSHLFNSL